MNAPAQRRTNPREVDPLDPSGLQAWITWGDLQTQNINAAGSVTLPGVQGTIKQLVQLVHAHPTTWTIQLYLDLTQGAWVVGDIVFVQWQVSLATGKAIVNQRIAQSLTITPNEPGKPFVQQQTTIQQAAAQRINVVPSQVGWTVADNNARVLTWAAWCAPIVR